MENKDQEGGGVNTSNREGKKRNNCFFEQGNMCVCVKRMCCLGDISPWQLFSDFQEAMRALSSGDSRTREIYLLSIHYFEEGTEA